MLEFKKDKKTYQILKAESSKNQIKTIFTAL